MSTPTTPAQWVAVYEAAEIAVLAGQTVSVGGRSRTMADLSEIRAGATYWRRQVGQQATVARGGNPHAALATWQK